MRRALFALLPLPGATGVAWAEQPVLFADPKLKALVERELGVADPTPTDMLNPTGREYVEGWDERDDGVPDISGLEYARNLLRPALRLNRIGGISVLSGLTNLTTLNLSKDAIRDISPLSALTHRTDLNLQAEKISDIPPPAGLRML